MTTKLFFCFFCFFSTLLIGQSASSKEKELSNIEKFSSKSGTLFQKQYVSIGTVKKVEIKIVTLTDLIDATSQNGLKFEYEYAGKYSTETKQAMLDTDEIAGLIKSIKIMQEKIFPTTVTNYTEVIYRSRSGFEAGCFWGSKNSWSVYLKIEKYDSNSYVFLEKEDFPILLSLLEKAKAKL